MSNTNCTTNPQVLLPTRETVKPRMSGTAASGPGCTVGGSSPALPALPDARLYEFDACLPGATTQAELYDTCGIGELVEAALDGCAAGPCHGLWARCALLVVGGEVAAGYLPFSCTPAWPYETQVQRDGFCIRTNRERQDPHRHRATLGVPRRRHPRAPAGG